MTDGSNPWRHNSTRNSHSWDNDDTKLTLFGALIAISAIIGIPLILSVIITN